MQDVTAAPQPLSVLSEEAGYIDNGSPWLAVVDPLDGSRNAGRGIPLHCTSVAVGAKLGTATSTTPVERTVAVIVFAPNAPL